MLGKLKNWFKPEAAHKTVEPPQDLPLWILNNYRKGPQNVDSGN